MANHRPPLSIEEAASYLGVTPRYMRRAVHERRLPFHRLPGGRALRFLPDDLDDFLAAGRIDADAAESGNG